MNQLAYVDIYIYILYIYIYTIYIYTIYANRRLSPRLYVLSCCRRMLISLTSDDERTTVSALHPFCVELAASWAKRSTSCDPLAMDDYGICIWQYVPCRSLHTIRTPHAWPTLLATRKGVSFKSFQYICSCSFIELWRAKVRSELQIYMAACYDLYQKNKGSVHVHADTT